MNRDSTIRLLLTVLSCLLSSDIAIAAETDSKQAQSPTGPGTTAEPIRYVGHDVPDLKFHDGRIPPTVGVQNIQVMRANRTHPDADGADGVGWTYNHAPMLAYWNGKFYLEYLSTPVSESLPPGQTLLVESADGFHWSRPRVVFAPYKISDEIGMSISHQRMGFYIAPNGRLLVLSFYGRGPGVNDGTGVGRAVREVNPDDSIGPVYFIRYNRQNGWNETNTAFPFYKTSTNAGFVAACDALLTNKLVTQQWWEEDQGKDGLFALASRDKDFDAKALSYYHRNDGAVVGLWKKRWAALTFDEGKSWTDPVRSPTIVTGGAKIWGQRTDDGRYALVFNPDGKYRYPLVVMSGPDGVVFDNMLVVHGAIPYPRYYGKFKSLGPQYVRGITESEGNPPGNDLWLTYSVNKEDMWVARIPVPIRGTVDQPVKDNFDDQPVGPVVRDWNTYSPLWAPVAVVRSPDGAPGNCLELRDEDRYDYAKAARVFPSSTNATLHFRVRAEQLGTGTLEIEVLDRRGARPVRLALLLFFRPREGQTGSKMTEVVMSDSRDGKPVSLAAEDTIKLVSQIAGTHVIELSEIASLKVKRWYGIEIRVNTTTQKFDVQVDGKRVLKDAQFAEPVTGPVERLCFRTGPFRDFDAKVANELVEQAKIGDRLDGDEKVSPAVFHVDDVSIR